MKIESVSQQVVGMLPSFTQIARNCNKVAIVTVALAALSQLPQTDATTPIGAMTLPVCLGGCIAALAASTGGWGAFVGYTACKSACVALALIV